MCRAMTETAGLVLCPAGCLRYLAYHLGPFGLRGYFKDYRLLDVTRSLKSHGVDRNQKDCENLHGRINDNEKGRVVGTTMKLWPSKVFWVGPSTKHNRLVPYPIASST